MMKYVICLGLILGAFLWGSLCVEPETTTIIKTDTLTITKLVPDTVILVRVDTLSLPVLRSDTLILTTRDTVKVLVPLSLHIFESPGSYRAEVLGFNCELQSMKIYQNNTTNTVVERTRFSHGVQLGFGGLYGTRGYDLGFYFGYGFSFIF